MVYGSTSFDSVVVIGDLFDGQIKRGGEITVTGILVDDLGNRLNGNITATIGNEQLGNATFTNLGNDSLTITTTTGDATTSIDGSAVSNGAFLIIDDGSNTNNDTLIGGSGDDIFRTSGTNMFNADDVITGNAGDDTIQLDNDSAVQVILDFNDVTGVENIDTWTVDGISSGAADIEILPGATTALNTGAITVDATASTAGTLSFLASISVPSTK